MDAPRQPSRHVLGMIFLTVLMDIIGFAVIIPMFPRLLEHYLGAEGEPGTLVSAMVGWASSLAGGQSDPMLRAVLFGGMLSALFSGLQFICSPIWGALSDRIGRRPVLVMTLLGNALAYLLWIFAGQFWILVLSRVLCGLAAGNIAVASAAAADITDRENRAKGMAVVGVAIGMGFLLGPVIGGFASAWVLPHATADIPALALNPFSGPAIVSAIMATANFLIVWLTFPETLASKGVSGERRPTFFALARVRDGGVRRASVANLLYQVAFTGMENTVVFLTAALFLFSPRDNAWLFLSNGLCLMLAQGLAARLLVRRIGERAVAGIGFVAGALALACISQVPYANLTGSEAPWLPVFFVATGLLAFATGLILPSLSALVSLYSSADDQGRNLGILRSAGALARIVGPLAAAYVFFHTGTHSWVYLAGATLMLPGLWMVLRLPDPRGSGSGELGAQR